MHVTVRRKEFLAAFGRVSPAAPSRSPKAILCNVKFTASDDPEVGATLAATDLETGIRHRVSGVTVLSPGSAVLPTAKVQSILSSCGDAELDISVDDGKIVIVGERARFNLPSENPDLFPEIPSFPEGGYHAVAAGDMRKMIRRTTPCCDPESVRYALGGCLVELSDDSITMVATDGRRLAKVVAPAEPVGGATAPVKGPVIPMRALKLIDKNLDGPDVLVHLAFQGGSAALVRTSDGATTIFSRLVEGRFPAYRDVIPDSVDFQIPLDVAELRAAVEQASIVVSEESRGTDFAFTRGKLTLSSQAADVGSSRVEMATGHDGPDVEIAFDCRYLSDALKTMDDGSTVTAGLTDHKSAAKFTTDDGGILIIMPLTRDR
jgi:DNA polymerase-3 subunit beta